ncbi:MAG: hypothetical protein R3A79_15015 [Nannocystaceae bacterium]
MPSHDLRPPTFGPQRRLGAQLLRITLFTASLATLAGFVAADVFAAEPEVAAFDDDDARFDADDELAARPVFAAVTHIPEGDAPAASSPPEPKKPPKKVRKKRPSKLAFGRFEGY